MTHPHPQDLRGLLKASDALHGDIEQLLSSFDWPELDAKGVAVLTLGQLTFEHGVALRALMGVGLSTSAVALLRVQFESLVRAAWLLHVATEEQAAKLSVPLSAESEQGAKNIPSADELIARIERHGPRGAGALLRRFYLRVVRTLHSFVHAGIHPVQRRATGYPEPLLCELTKCSNAVSMLACVVMSELCGLTQSFNSQYARLHERHHGALPALEPLAHEVVSG